MKKLVILIFVFFSFTLSAKEIVFKVTNSNRINLTKGQFIRVAPMYSDGNVNFGELQFYGNTSFNVNFFLKKNLTDFMLFLKFDETYDLYWLKFLEKTGNFILTNGVNNIELQLVISTNNHITSIQVENKNNIDYLNSIFSVNDNLSFLSIDPILSSTIEPSIFDHLDIQDDGCIVINKELNTIDVYSKVHVIKKTIKCNSIISGEKMIIDCNYKNINETIGIFDTLLETSKGIKTNILKLNKSIVPSKFVFKSVDSLFFVNLSKDITSPDIMLIEPKLSRDLVVKPKSRYVQIRGIVSDTSKIKFTTINDQDIQLNGKFFSKTLSSDKSPFYVKIKSIDEYGNIAIREFEVEIPKEEPIEPIEESISGIDNVGNYFALIIGINQYEDKRIPQLDNPIKDAKTLKNTLVQKYTFENNNVIFLENANRKSIFKALVEIKGLIGKNDNLLLFYAGHGFFDKEMDSGYWLPSDSEKDNKSEWISFDDVIHHLRAINSKHTLVISDACFSGGFLKERSVTLSDKAMTDLYQVPSRKVITSGNLTTVPDESVFMKYLVRTLNDNQESYLTEEMLFDKIKIPVVNNSDTTPLIGVLSKTGDEGGNFIFIKR